ncbi:MAG: site-specific integrase [Clostridia bacterium]|nr:site-specific integrase [Clostridia bacterium]
MKAKKLPSGSWNVQVFVGLDQNGKKIRKSFTAPTKKEAEYLAASFKAHHQEVTRDSTAMTLSEAIDKYIEFKGATLSPSTIRGYRFIQRKSLQAIMNIKINKLTLNMIQAAVNAEIKEKKAKTLKNEIGLVKSVLKMYAPSLSLNGLTLPQRERFEAQELTLQEVTVLFNSILNDDLAIPLLLALCCGLRASEINALKWSDYDKKIQTIYIHSATVRGEDGSYVTKGTKTTNSTRTISIPEFLSARLNSSEITSDYIVNASQSAIRRHLDKICKENNIPHVRLHDLRHINASIMLYLNVPSKYALERGGWDDIKTMDKIYQFTFKDEKKIVDSRINNFFENAIS